MDVISNTTENQNKCDEQIINEKNESDNIQFDDKKKFEFITQNLILNNKDTIDQGYKNESNFIHYSEKDINNDNGIVVKNYLDNYDNYNKYSCTDKIKSIKSNTERSSSLYNVKIASKETNDKSKKAISVDCNLKSDRFSPYSSNSLNQQNSNEIKITSIEKSSDSVNINIPKTNRNYDENQCKDGKQIFEVDTCFSITDKPSEIPFENKGIKLKNRCDNQNIEYYECKDNIKSKGSMYPNNLKKIKLNEKPYVNHLSINNSPILPTYNYGYEDETKNFNGAISETLHSNSIQPTFTNQIYDNTIFSDYKNKIDDEVSSSNIDKKTSTNDYTKSDSFDYYKNKINVMLPENLENNVPNLCKEKSFNIVTPTTSDINKNIKEFTIDSKKGDDNNFFNINYTSYDSFQQPVLGYEKYKVQRLNMTQEQNNLNVLHVPQSDTCNNKKYFPMSSPSSKTSESLSSWNKNEVQRKNFYEYNKVKRSKCIDNNLIHNTNSYTSNMNISDDSCTKFAIQVESSIEHKNYINCSINPSIEVNKLSYPNSQNHAKCFPKQSSPLANSKIKGLTQLQMNPPDFSKISMIETTQKENDISRKPTEYNSVQKKKNYPVTSQNFDEISKKFNYIKDLQLKNPITNQEQSSKYKESYKKNFDFRTHNSYSNLYVKTPNFSTEIFNKSDKVPNINNNIIIANFNTDPMTTISNDLSTTDSNILHTRNYQELSKTRSPIIPNIQFNTEINKTNISNEFHIHPKNNCEIMGSKKETDIDYYRKKCRENVDKSNHYYSTNALYHDGNATAYKDYNQDFNVRKNPICNTAPNLTVQHGQSSQNYFTSPNNYQNCDRNKRTTSVIQSNKKLNFISSKTKDQRPNWNESSTQEEISNCLCQHPQSLNSNSLFSNNSQTSGINSLPTNVPNSGNIDFRRQTKNEENTLQKSTHNLESVQSAISDSMFQNSKLIQSSQSTSPLTKTIIKQLKKPSVPPSLDWTHSYYNPTKDLHLLPSINTDSSTYKQSDKILEYNNNSHLNTEKIKHTKSNEMLARSAFKYSSASSSTKFTPEIPRTVQKPNYREMINNVYAMRNSRTEDDLNLQIIKRTLNYDVSHRKSENDLEPNNFEVHVSKKPITYLGGNSLYYHNSDDRKTNSKNADIPQNGYIESHEIYSEQPYNMPIPKNDISVTFSNVTKPKDTKSTLVSNYPKAVITKLFHNKTENLVPSILPSTCHRTLNEPTTIKKNITAPLDLSVKTVKTKADSTGCDDGNLHNFITFVEGTRSAPKFVFQPNFSNNVENTKDKNTITSSEKHKNSQTGVVYNKQILPNFDKSYIKENTAQGRSYYNKIGNFSPSLLNYASASPVLTADSDDRIINTNKIKSNALYSSNDKGVKIERNPIYHEYNNDQINWHQTTQSYNNVHKKNIQKQFNANSPNHNLYGINNHQQDFDRGNIVHKYKKIFIQKSNDLNSIQMKQQQQTDNRNNATTKNDRNLQIIPLSMDNNQKIDVDLSMRKRQSDVTKQLPAKKIRVDDIYKAHLEEQTKDVLNKNIIPKSTAIMLSDNLEKKYNEKIVFVMQPNSEAYCHPNSEKLRKKIWYPPIQEANHSQQSNNILSNEHVDGSQIPITNNSTPKAADQNVISKLKNSLEARENEKQKLARLAENTTKNQDTSKSDIASLLAARIRTKGELKGFHPNISENIKDTEMIQLSASSSNIIKIEKLSEKIDEFSQNELNSAFDIIDWRSACNDFVEQLKYDVNRQQSKKLRNTMIKSCMNDNNVETIESHSKIDSLCDSKNSFVNQLNSHCIPCNERNTKRSISESSDEDKPLLLLRHQSNSNSNSQLNNNLFNYTDIDKTIHSTSREPILQICNEVPVNKTVHNSIVEKLSEKIGRNIREKQRIEQEKRLAARLGKTSSSESEDNKRNQRPKKSKMTKSRFNNALTNRDVSETDSSETESTSISKNYVRNRGICKKNKHLKIEKDFETNTSNNNSKTKSSEQLNIDVTKLITDKQIMTKGEMKFMVSSKEPDNNILEQNKNNELLSIKNEDKDKDNNVNYKVKIKKGSSSNQKTEIKIEETMTRSKRKAAIEKQIANSKILRNYKVIKYINIDRIKNANNKKDVKNNKITKNQRCFKTKNDKKNLTYKNDSSHMSSASSGEFETVSDRLRPRLMCAGNNRNIKKDTQLNSKNFKEKLSIEKKTKHTITHTKKNIIKKKIEQNENNTSKFPPGWEDQVYEYKKSLKIPLRLITIKAPHNHRISTSLPDLDSHSSDDALEQCTKKQKLVSYKNPYQKIEEAMSINCENSVNKIVQSFSDKINNAIEVHTQEKICSPKSIIDVLHSRVIRSNKKIVKKNVKTFSKIIPRSKNEYELLPTPATSKASEQLDEHYSVFKTEILKSRTRTETRNLKNKELIREVFGGEDRPASAPPEIHNADNKLETISFEKKYEEYLQKMNVDFGEKINKPNITEHLKEIPHKEDQKTVKNSIMDISDSPFRNANEIHNEFIKECTENPDSVNNITLNIISDREDVPNIFKHKRSSKYRRKGSSGFDYIRKKKKPTSTLISTCTQEHLKRKKASPIEFHHSRDENDVCREIQKWVLNKSVGQSALHKAARLGYLDVIVYCLERMGMNPDPKDNAGYTPLHEACSKGRIDIARVLLQYGANHSETAHSGIRPLHEASENGYIEIVRLLLSYGADPLLTTYSGQTPLMLSESNEMEQFLKNHLYDVQNTGPHKQPWKFPGPWKIFDPYKYGYDVMTGAVNFENITEINDYDISHKYLDSDRKSLSQFNSIEVEEGDIFQIEEADIPLPPLYLLKDEGSAKWVLLSDLCNLLKVKSKDTLLKQICPSTPPSTMNKELLRELKMSDFLEKATCLQLLCAGEKLNIRASKVVLVKYDERVQTLLGVKTVVMKF